MSLYHNRAKQNMRWNCEQLYKSTNRLFCVYWSGNAMKSVIYKEKLNLINESNPQKSSVTFGFYLSHLQFLSAKNDLGGEHKMLSVFVMIVG